MSCKIEIKSLEYLKEQGALGDARVVKDLNKFNELNEALTLLASEKYNITSPNNEQLFRTQSKYVKNLDGSYRYILRAEPNNKLFDILQIAVDEYKITPIQYNNVNYTLKAIDILSSTKGEQTFTKGKKNNWSLDRILTELQIPKEQKQLILNSVTDKASSTNTKDVEELFNSNPKLAKIGTPQQYSQYLDTIFPDSKVKDIVYHGGTVKDIFSKESIGKSTINNNKNDYRQPKAFYFTSSIQSAKTYGNVVKVVLNLKNPKVLEQNLEDEGFGLKRKNKFTDVQKLDLKNKDGFILKDIFDAKSLETLSTKELIENDIIKQKELNNKIESQHGDTIGVFEPEQIHILGSESDIDGFKEFVNQDNNSQILEKPNVILPIGISGSGKSTFIKSLPQENLVVIEPDTMRVEFTGDINNKSKDKEIYEEAAKRAVTAIKQGKQVVFDTTNLTKKKRLPFIEAIKKEIPNANIQYKLMELNPELAKQRIKLQIERGEKRANVSDATIDRHAESYKQMLEDIKNEPISEFNPILQQKQSISPEELAIELFSKYNIKKITDEYGNTWNEINLENVDTKILLKEIDFNDLLDDKQSEQLYLEELNTHEPFSNEEEHGTINEFILFNNQESKENYKATEVLENIINNFDGFSEQSKLFLEKSRILLANTKANVKLVNDNELINDTTFMQYDPADNSIHISLNKLRLVSTNFAIHAFLHEVTHSVTIRAYYNPITAEQRLFRNLIDEAYKKYNTGYDRNSDFDSYGFSNQVEFIAEIFTNPSFIQEIKRRDELEKTNFWKQLIDYIRSLFGLSKSAKYNDLVEAITNITYTKQINSRGQIFEIKSPIKIIDESKFTSLKTIDDKLEYTIDKLEESLKRNIQSLEFTSKITKNESRLKNIEVYIKDFNNILKEVQEYRNTNQIQAISIFVGKISANMNYIKNRINNIDYSDESEVKNILRVYQDYLSTFSVINNVKKVISAIRVDINNQDIITKDDLENIESQIKIAVGEYEYLKSQMDNIMKKAMKVFLNDIKYFKKVEYKHRERLSKEHKQSKIPENKETWIIDKMLNRDKDLIQKDVEDAAQELIENPSYDIISGDVMFSSAINVSSPLIQIMNQILFDIKNEKNLEIQTSNNELNNSFEKLSKEKNSTNPKDLYANIYEYTSDGKPFIKSDYSIKFYEEVHLKLIQLYKELRELKNTLYDDLAEIKIKEGKSSSKYISKRREIQQIIKNKTLVINNIKKNNIDWNDDGTVIGPKAKWKNNLNNLSKTEQEVLKLAKDRIEKSHKNTYGQDSLINFSFGVKFYELPKVTKSNLERIILDKGKGIINDKLKDFKEIRPDDIGYDSTIRTDIENNRIYNIKVHYRDKSGEFKNKNQSLDLFNLLRLETENGTMFRIRKESELILNSLIDIAKNKDYYQKEGSNKLINYFSKKYNIVNGKDTNIYKMMNNIMEQKFYDMFNKSNIKLGKVDLNKTVKFINSSSAFLTLSLNLASGTANVINANAQLFLESFLPMKGGFINSSGIAKANKIYGQNMISIMQDLTNPINKSFVNQINEIFDIKDSLNLTNSGFLKTNMVKAGFDTASLQVFQTSGEHWIQSVTVMAVLDGIKALNKDGKYIDKEGKEVDEKKAASLLDMLEIDKINGIIKMSDKVVYSTHSRLTKWNEGGKTNVDMLIRKKLYDTVGNYTELDQPDIMRHWGGKLMMLYRKYLIPMGQSRLRGWETSFKRKENLTDDEERFSYALQENEEGNYVTLLRFLSTVIKDQKYYLLSKPHWDKLTDYEKHNIKRAVTETALIYGVLPLMLMFIKGLADGDDDEYLYFLAYQIRRLDTELSQYQSMTEMFKMMRSPIPSARLLETVGSTVSMIFHPWDLDEEYKAGENKGKNKFFTKIKKQIPVVKEFQRSYQGLLKYQESTVGTGL